MPFLRPRSKYHAKKAEYAGESYDSKAEAAYAKHLDSDLSCAAGGILFYNRQPKFTLGCPENIYKPDFLIVYQRHVVAVDIKGHETPKFKKDRKLWAKYGPCPLQIVRLKLKYPKAGSDELPAIKGVEFDIVHGGRDRRVYGPLHPEWLRQS